MSIPAVSVLVSVYNGEKYLAAAIDSVLAQTFGDFELVVVDDGSTDGTAAILADYGRRDRRVRVVPLEKVGLSRALNIGLEACRGELIARLDADDLCLPERFAVQVEYMREHPECVAVGAWAKIVDPTGEIEIGRLMHPVAHEDIERNLLGIENKGGLVAPAVMMRRGVTVEIGGYREEMYPTDDRDLWLRLAERGKLANIPQFLIKYRHHLSSISHAQREQQKDAARRTIADARARRGISLELPVMIDNHNFNPYGTLLNWTRFALEAGNSRIARRYALQAARIHPLRLEVIKLMIRSYVGQAGYRIYQILRGRRSELKTVSQAGNKEA